MERGLLVKLDNLVSVPEELEQNPYLRQVCVQTFFQPCRRVLFLADTFCV